MVDRTSLFENSFVTVAIFLSPVATMLGVRFLAPENLSSGTAWVIAAATSVPAFLAAFSIVYFIDGARGPNQFATMSMLGVTASRMLYAEAILLFYSPLLAGAETFITFTAWVVAMTCLILGRAATRRRRDRNDLAQLTRSDEKLAIRFLVRPDKKGWSEINPYTVSTYQRRFEDALSAMGLILPADRWSITDDQVLRMMGAATQSTEIPRRADHELLDMGGEKYFPGPTVALVLAFLDASPARRFHERSVWAAAVATSPEAARIRTELEPHVADLFRSYATGYRG